MQNEMNVKRAMDIGVKVSLAAGFCILFGVQLQSENKLVYVDVQKLGTDYKGMQVARKEFDSKSAVWRANLDTLRGEAEKKIMEYEGKKSKLTPQEKKLMEELIRSKQEQFENYQGVIREKIQNEDKELTGKVLGKINDYIKRYGQQKGYRIILAATQYGNIVYAKEDIDITGEILKGLNAEYN